MAVGGGALIRYKVFAEGITQDLDGIGTAFGVLVGVAILLTPILILVYVKGSRPVR